MGNHWHFVVHPEESATLLSRFFGYLSLLHATRWQAAHGATGTGHVYQSRFKHFMVELDRHLLAVLRYVERNALAAGLVRRAQDWRWSSLHVRRHGPAELKQLLSDWPVEMPRDWSDWVRQVNQPQSDKEQAAIRRSIQRGAPFGDEDWAARMTKRYHLQSTLRPRGRQKGWRKAKQTTTRNNEKPE